MRTYLLGAVYLIAWWGWSAPVRGEEGRAVRLWVTGSDETVWVVERSEPEAEGLPVIQMWYAGKKEGKAAQPKRNRFLPAVLGEPIFVGADAAGLRVLFSDLSTRDYFGDRESMVGAWWRGQSNKKPLAWGGDAAEVTFWALGETDALTAPTTQAGDDEAGASEQADIGEEVEAVEGRDAVETTESGEGTAADKAVKDAASGPLTVLRLRDDVWRRLPLLSEASEGKRFWLSGRSGDLYLFWQMPGQGVLSATLSEGAWSEPEVVTAQGDVAIGWAGAWSGGPVFVAGVGGSEGRVQLRPFLRQDGAWSDKGAARDGTELLWIDPAVCGVGIVRGQLGVARLTKDGKVAFGLGDLGVSPSIRFSVLSLARAEPLERSGWQEAILFGLVLGVLIMVFWTHRERVARPAIVPNGMILAAVHRRVIATILDYVPALLVVMLFALPWLVGKMDDVPQGFDWSALQEQAEDPEVLAVLVPVHYVSIVLYGLWCLIWELSIGTTPGKLLFGCRVVCTEGGRPHPGQVVIRNAARVVVFALGSPGLIVTLMTMLLVTRNRQRIGDLLANTIVIEPGAQRRDRGTGRGDDRLSGPTR